MLSVQPIMLGQTVFRMTFKTASIVFWAVIVALLGARVALHDQIALGATPGHVIAWLRTLVG